MTRFITQTFRHHTAGRGADIIIAVPYRGILRYRGCPASGTRHRGTEEAQAVDQRHHPLLPEWR